jgi:hypothetical protein
MTTRELEAIGKRLYGAERWKPLLAAKIGVTLRTVQRWATGSTISRAWEIVLRGL